MKTPSDSTSDLVARVFRVVTTAPCAKELLARFRTTSAQLVLSKAGLVRYSIYEALDGSDAEVMFESVWSNLEQIQLAFGDSWKEPHLPEGYEALIKSCSVTHYRVDQHLAPNRLSWP